jgi:hypothetical protein
MDYINLARDIQILIAQALERINTQGIIKLTLACKATHALTLAVTADNDKRFKTAANHKGTYIATCDFNSFCNARENEGTLSQYRFSVFINDSSRFPACPCLTHGCQRKHSHIITHLNLWQLNWREYHGIVLKPAHLSHVELYSHATTRSYMTHSVESYTHCIPSHVDKLQSIEMECTPIGSNPSTLIRTQEDMGFGSMFVDFKLAVKYTVV